MQHEKEVCLNCIDNVSLKEYIKINGKHSSCNYCRGKKDECISIPINKLAKEIIKRIEIKYMRGDIYALKGDEDYHSFIIETMDIISSEVLPVNKELADDLYSLIGPDVWVNKYDFMDSPDEEIAIRWEKFCEKIKEELSEEERNKILKETLEPICQYIIDCGIIDTIDSGTRFYRARRGALDPEKITHEDLGPPPEEKAKSNRFTKAGESAFYGSKDDVTSILEVCEESDAVMIGVFETTVALDVIDLYKIAKELKQDRSVFEDNIYAKRFLDYYSIKIAVSANEKDPRNYIPTQEMLRFFRKELKEKYGVQINGLLYPSSKTRRNTTNCILFFNKDDCTDDKKNEDKPLKLIKKEIIVYPSGYWRINDKHRYPIEFKFNSNK